jgi:hypothetical protein
MPPERPPYLAILDASFDGDELKVEAEYFDTPDADARLLVRWGVGEPPAGYERDQKGVVFVAGAIAPRRDLEEPPTGFNSGSGLYSYSEHVDGSWMMLVLILPVGQTLSESDPAPSGSRIYGDRLAVYWRLQTDAQRIAKATWRLRPTKDRARALEEIRAAPLPADAEEKAPEFAVFLSYRRLDDRWPAGRIRDRLTRELGERAVFRDIDSIPLGDYRRAIDEAIGRCKVMLAVMGPTWFDPPLPVGERKIDSQASWVRMEIESALQRHKLIVPVVLDDSPGPEKAPLPEPLSELAFRQACRLREESFEADMGRLVKQLRSHVT